jgi:polyisoprenoid-binding protein YceI
MTTATTTQIQTSPTTWQIDPSHTLVELSAQHMMFTTVKGRFTGVKGTIVENQDDVALSSVEAEIDAASISTGDAQRDAHLQSPDFLDVEQYPTITFRSTAVEGTREQFRLIGDLTIRGVTRPVSLDVEFGGSGKNPWSNEVAGFTATGQIYRQDFGLNWNVVLESGVLLVSDKVNISLEVYAVKQEG